MADRLARSGDAVGAAGWLRERDQWVALADEVDAYLRGDLLTDLGPTSEDVAMF